MFAIQPRLRQKWLNLSQRYVNLTTSYYERNVAVPVLKNPELSKNRYVKFASIQDGVGVIKLCNPDSKVNVVNMEFIWEAVKITEEGIHNPDFKSFIVISEKPDCFVAGGDINIINDVDKEIILALSSTSNKLNNSNERMKKPIVAAIMGTCLGGGLELAMGCDYRVAVNSSKTTLGLPEVMLGLTPGGGGTQRLPKLVGLPSALDLMLTGKSIKAAKAKKLGLVDKLVEELGPGTASGKENTLKYLENVAVQIAKDLADGKMKIQRHKPWTSVSGLSHHVPLKVKPVRDFVFKKAKETVLKKTMGLYPAPLKAIEVVSYGLEHGFEKGWQKESEVFVEMTQTREAKSLMGLFNGQVLKRSFVVNQL